MLLLQCDWGERLPEFANAPLLPPRKVSRPQFPMLDPSFASLEEEVNRERQLMDSQRCVSPLRPSSLSRAIYRCVSTAAEEGRIFIALYSRVKSEFEKA